MADEVCADQLAPGLYMAAKLCKPCGCQVGPHGPCAVDQMLQFQHGRHPTRERCKTDTAFACCSHAAVGDATAIFRNTTFSCLPNPNQEGGLGSSMPAATGPGFGPGSGPVSGPGPALSTTGPDTPMVGRPMQGPAVTPGIEPSTGSDMGPAGGPGPAPRPVSAGFAETQPATSDGAARQTRE